MDVHPVLVDEPEPQELPGDPGPAEPQIPARPLLERPGLLGYDVPDDTILAIGHQDLSFPVCPSAVVVAHRTRGTIVCAVPRAVRPSRTRPTAAL